MIGTVMIGSFGWDMDLLKAFKNIQFRGKKQKIAMRHASGVMGKEEISNHRSWRAAHSPVCL
jgi:hypothetical protein